MKKYQHTHCETPFYDLKVNRLTIKFKIKFNNKVKVKTTIKSVVLTFQIID